MSTGIGEGGSKILDRGCGFRWHPPDVTEVIPAFATIVLMAFTYNIGVGMTAGLVLYPLMKIAAGRWREIHPALIPLSAFALLFFVFYPYHA